MRDPYPKEVAHLEPVFAEIIWQTGEYLVHYSVDHLPNVVTLFPLDKVILLNVLDCPVLACGRFQHLPLVEADVSALKQHVGMQFADARVEALNEDLEEVSLSVLLIVCWKDPFLYELQSLLKVGLKHPRVESGQVTKGLGVSRHGNDLKDEALQKEEQGWVVRGCGLLSEDDLVQVLHCLEEALGEDLSLEEEGHIVLVDHLVDLVGDVLLD